MGFDPSAPPDDADQCSGQALQEDLEIVVTGIARRGTDTGGEFDVAVARLVDTSAIFWDGFESGDITHW